ncbi:Egg cell-secreted protein 1.4 [Apostasia shenzhenica]|uniref:Egg cell-secreted protein 1.4 n=1 Tax=Apostasia shenzhenica TaxID=1088818 RepID=A0A2I0AEH4_9ASPA|nr:Egg cell-secreted protein 1.4 [Apostasia shenzhenica]
MALLPKLASLALAVCLLASVAGARELNFSGGGATALADRLAAADNSGGLADCWGALLELRSCTNEIILFFLNGESYLTVDCCRSIRIITRRCWPSMLTSVGFTAEEGDILRGYCDADEEHADASSGAPPPAAAPAADEMVA